MKLNTQNHHKSPVVKEYSQLAEKYDERWSFYIESSIQETLKRVELKSGEKLLDIGCGTGALLEALSVKYPNVELTGIDPTQEMLGVAREKLPISVYLKRGWAEKLPFEDNSFNITVSCNMFHYIQDPVAALHEALRVLQPTGTFIATDWCDDYITCKVCDLFLHFFNSAHFKTYRKQECHDLLVSAGFNNIEIERYKINWFWGMMTAAAHKIP